MHDLIRIAAIATALLMPLGAFAAQRAGADAGGVRLAQMCEAGSRDIAGLPIEQFQRIIGPDTQKRAALDALGNATVKAGQDIKAACPAQAALSAPARLSAMQARLTAMIAAVATVKSPLERFYGLLNDEEKEAIVALGRKERQGPAGSLLDQDCGAAQPSMWPAADIERAVHPSGAQRASLAALENSAAKAADWTKSSCAGDDLLTPTARLAAVGKRLGALLQSVNAVIPPLNEFYGTLDDAQKARFNAISVPQAKEAAEPKEPKAKPIAHHRSTINLGYLVRRLIRGF